ncbi:hypothetical protein H0H87_009896, partial [Tephrocybe sp. NHM501043]
MTNPETCMKHHATNANVATEDFMFEAIPESLLSPTLSVVVKIGIIGDKSTEQITSLLESIPMALTQDELVKDMRFDSRVWVKRAVEALASSGIITCDDADTLVNGELLVLALSNYHKIRQGSGTYK